MLKILLARIGMTLLTSLLTEKFILNVTVILLERLAARTENDVDDSLLGALKEALDKREGKPVNLYEELRGK